jgi:predicted ATP-grasp superfamily ATP-dependent carboligase
LNRTLLLVSTAAQWLGTARMPRVLARAGFEVALLAPQDSIAAKSRYVSTVRYLAANASPLEFLAELTKMIDDVEPLLLVPCDEMAVRLLFALVLTPPMGLAPAARARFAALIGESLGDPRFYEASIDKTRLPAAAEALGVRVPPYAIVADADDTASHAAALGYPVVLKRRFGFAGEGVAVVSAPGELRDAAQRLLRSDQLDLGEQRMPQLLVQAFISGPHHSQALVALRGEPLGSFAWERYVWTREVKGQTAVLRFVDSPETRMFSEQLCRGFGISGFFNAQYLIDANTGAAHLLEINRRIVTHTHLGERVGADLPQALEQALDGKPPRRSARAGSGDGGCVAIFPREWLRDPASPYLSTVPCDVPWDDPELLTAMVRSRNLG